MSPMIELILDQIEGMSDDEDRNQNERNLLKLQVKELRAEFERLEKIAVGI